MAEKGDENIYTDNHTADPGETENDRKVKSAMGIQQTALTSQSVDSSSENIDHVEDFDNRPEMTTNLNPLNEALLLAYKKKPVERKKFEPEGLKFEPSTSTSSSFEIQSSNLFEQQMDSTPQLGNNSAEAAEQSTQSTHYDSDHVDATEVALSMTELSILEEPTEPGTHQSEDYTPANVRTPPTLPQPAYEHTAPTTLSEEIPHAPSHFDILSANEDSLPVTREASDRGSRVIYSEDKGDWDLPTEPIQPESVSFKISCFRHCSSLYKYNIDKVVNCKALLNESCS